MEKHFKLTNSFITNGNGRLYQIEATRDILVHFIKKGELGGYIQSESNIKDNAWVGDNAKVFGNAKVSDNAQISNNAMVFGDAKVSDNAQISDNAMVFGDAKVSDNVQVFGDGLVFGDVRVYGNVIVSNDAMVSGNTMVFGDTMIRGDSNVKSNDDYCVFKNFGSRNGNTTFTNTKNNEIFVSCGCFEDYIDIFEQQVEKTHGDNKFGKEYKAMIELAKIKLNYEKTQPTRDFTKGYVQSESNVMNDTNKVFGDDMVKPNITKCSAKIPNYYFGAKSGFNKDEFIFRDLVGKLVNDMTYEDLLKIFPLKKIDPFSKESEKILGNSDTMQYFKDEILSLRRSDLLLYEIKYEN